VIFGGSFDALGDRLKDPAAARLPNSVGQRARDEVASPLLGALARHDPVANPGDPRQVMADPDTGATLRFLSTTTVFGTATGVTLADLTLDGF
jgi:hypothetical protein